MKNYFSEEEISGIILYSQLDPKFDRQIPEFAKACLDGLNIRYGFHGTEQIKDYYWFIADNFEIVGKAIENGAVAEIMPIDRFPDGQSVAPKTKVIEDMYRQKELWPDKKL